MVFDKGKYEVLLLLGIYEVVVRLVIPDNGLDVLDVHV
jgi:hypothetical protein